MPPLTPPPPHRLRTDSALHPQTIDVMVEQIAQPWTAPPATITTHAAAISERVLSSGLGAGGSLRSTCAQLSTSEVDAIIRSASGPHARPSRLPVLLHRPRLLTPLQCVALIEHIEQHYASALAAELPANDLKISISLRELDALIGSAAAASIMDLGLLVAKQSLSASRQLLDEASEPTLRLSLRRRCAEVGNAGARIGFHRDVPRAVVNIALNGSDCYLGGRLLLAVDGCVLGPERSAGCATALDNAVVHGVSCLTAGVRYTLLAAFDVA